MKKADQDRRNKEAKIKHQKLMPKVDGKPRFAGGGFNLDQVRTVLKTE